MAFIRGLQIMAYRFYTDLPGTGQNGDMAWCQDTNLTYRYSSTLATWMPLVRDVVKQSTVLLDLTQTGTTAIYTLEGAGSFEFYPTQITFRISNVAGATLKPTFTAGSNASASDNIAGASLLGNLLGLTGEGTTSTTTTLSPGLAGGTVVYVKVSSGAIATNYKVYADISGYYGVCGVEYLRVFHGGEHDREQSHLDRSIRVLH